VTSWPVDRVPDGAALAPHHLYIGALVALVAVWVASDDIRDAEPVIMGTALLGVMFAFGSIWRWYPKTGAAFALICLLVATAAVVVAPFWRAYPWIGVRGVGLVGCAIAADDLVEHAFGVWTPLDWAFNTYGPAAMRFLFGWIG
jgi:hypothetical protein